MWKLLAGLRGGERNSTSDSNHPENVSLVWAFERAAARRTLSHTERQINSIIFAHSYSSTLGVRLVRRVKYCSWHEELYFSCSLRERKFAVDKFFTTAIWSFPQQLLEKLEEFFIRFWRNSMNANWSDPALLDFELGNFSPRQEPFEGKTHGECDELFYGILRGFSWRNVSLNEIDTKITSNFLAALYAKKIWTFRNFIVAKQYYRLIGS